jgi:hypothetical protein
LDKTQCAVGRHTAPGNLTQNSVAEQESSERNTSTWCRLKVNLEESAVTISWTKKKCKIYKEVRRIGKVHRGQKKFSPEKYRSLSLLFQSERKH